MAEQFGLSVILRLVDRLSDPMKRIEKSFRSMRDVYEKHGAGMRRMGKEMSTYLTLPIIGLGVLAVNTARSFDEAFGEMRKDIQGPADVITKLRDNLVQMSTRIPVAGEELLKMSASLARLNVPTDKLAQVTEIMSEFGKAAGIQDMASATKNFIRFAQAGGIAEGEYTNLASTLLELNNITSVGEENILQMSMDMSGLGKMIGLTTTQTLGLAAGIGSLGAEAIMPVRQMLLQLNKIMSGRDEKSKIQAGWIGKSTGLGMMGFKKLWKEDAAGAMALFAKTLDNVGKSGKDTVAILDALGMDGGRTVEVVAKLVTNTDKFTKAMKMSTEAYKANAGYTEHVRIEHEKLNAKLIIFYNKLRAVMLDLGTIIMPILSKIMDKITPILDGFLKLPTSVKVAIVVFGGLLAVLGPLVAVLGMAAGAMAMFGAVALPALLPIIAVIAAIAGAIAGIATGVTMVSKAWKNFWVAGDTMGSTTYGLVQGAILGKSGAAGGKSLNEIVLRIIGGGAVVEGVKKAGNAAVSIITGGYLGLTNTAGAQ